MREVREALSDADEELRGLLGKVQDYLGRDAPAVELADVLVRLAWSVSLPKLRKHPRGPKKLKPKKQSGAKIKHVATARILEARHKCTK